jgi:hypothetical protein
VGYEPKTQTIRLESGEQWVIMIRKLSDGAGEQNPNVYGTAENQSLYNVQCLSPTKSKWSGDNFMLFTAVTIKESIDNNTIIKGDGPNAFLFPTPVICLLKQQDEPNPPIPATFLEGVVDFWCIFDRNVGLYHMWFAVNAFTLNGGQPNTLDTDGSCLQVVGLEPSALGDDVGFNDFDATDCWVATSPDYTPQANSKDRRVWLHSTGKMQLLTYGAGNGPMAQPMMVLDRPEVVDISTVPMSGAGSGTCCTDIVQVNGDKVGPYYPGIVQNWDPTTQTWKNGPSVWVLDANDT